jgi:hypothetical protein
VRATVMMVFMAKTILSMGTDIGDSFHMWLPAIYL